MPDRGEEISLLRLEEFSKAVSQVYAPGCKVVVMSDGRVFADLVGVPDEAVSRYWEDLKKLVPSEHLEWDELDHHVAKPGAFEISKRKHNHQY